MSVPVTLAIVGGSCAIVAQSIAAVGYWFNAKAAKTHAEETAKIVRGNGKGDVAVMMESMIVWQENHDVEHERLDARIKARTRRINKEPVDG